LNRESGREKEMPRINPKIAKWARESAGLSVEEAAKRIGLADNLKVTAVAKLLSLEDGTKEPSRSVLRKMAHAYHRPLLVFYLAEPPRKSPRGKDFRTLPASVSPLENALVDALIRDVRARQETVFEALILQDEAVEQQLVSSLSMAAGKKTAVARLVQSLNTTREEFRAASNPEGAFRLLRTRAERAGAYVVLQGDLGSHHTAIGVDVFRGFALADKVAPFIVINDHDSPSAWSFTLLHEFVHLLLGETGVSGSRSETAVERFCNEVASDFLLDDIELQSLNVRDHTSVTTAQADITAFARPRRVSRTMVAYRLLRAGLISTNYWKALHQSFRELWLRNREIQRSKVREAESGPNYFIVRRHRVGNALIEFVRRTMGSGALTTTEAARVLAVSPQSVGVVIGGATAVRAA